MTLSVAPTAAPAFRPFPVRVARVRALSPSFRRVTVTGSDLDEFSSRGADQRIKVLFPLRTTGLADCPRGADWYAEWRALPAGRRNPMRTYTVRKARPLEREVDIDFVLHGPSGPASTWALGAQAGDELVLIGPNARFAGEAGVVTGLRRNLLRRVGLDRRSVAFMGYWRSGQAS